MKRKTLLIVAGAGTAFVIQWGHIEAADTCAEEITKLEQSLAGTTDAGMGRTARDAMDMAESKGMDRPEGMAKTPHAGEAPGTQATAAMNEMVENEAASPRDVQRQNQGEPTAAEQAQAERFETAAGPGVDKLLQRAREASSAGDEAKCMAALEQAKQAMNRR